MPEEMTMQSEMVADFFADTNGFENDGAESTSNAQSESISDAPVSQPEGQKPVNQNQQPALAPVQAVPAQQAKPAFEAGYPESMLFKTDERGNSVFDVSKAMEFTKPDPKVFQNVPDPIAELNKAQTPKEPEIPAWQQRLNERREAEQSMVQNLTLYETFLREAVNSGYSGQAAFDYAKGKIHDIVRAQTERSREEESALRESEFEKRIAEREESLQLSARSKTNIAVVDRKLGGNFEKLTMGYVQEGKYVQGIATNDMNTLFRLMHPEAEKNPAALKQTYENWWLKITSNEQTCRYVANIARMRLLEKSLPIILEAQRSAIGVQSSRMAEGQGKSPSNISHTPAAETKDSFDSWLNSAPGQKVDYVG